MTILLSGKTSLHVDQYSFIFLFIVQTISNFTLLHVQLFTGQKFLPLDVLPLHKKVSNLQECEGLQGDLGAPRGGQKIPADVTRASANRAAASVGGVGLGTREGTKEVLTPGCMPTRWCYKAVQTVHRVRPAPCAVISAWPPQAFAVIHKPLVG